LAKLVTNLLDVTILESGKLRLNSQPYFIDEVIGSSLSRVQGLIQGRTITVTLEEKLPLIAIDGLLIEQVLVNLLENAIRYTAPQTGSITLDVRIHCDKFLQISVSDNGKGIQKGDEQRIFEKFYTSGFRGDGNAGLGLAICKGIIEAHNGTIQGLNNPAGGATLRFWLPNLMCVGETDE
jgi:two-component system sensor histidine kinase KdpD